MDDGAGGGGSVVFQVIGDGRKLWESGLMKTVEAAKAVDQSVEIIRRDKRSVEVIK